LCVRRKCCTHTRDPDGDQKPIIRRGEETKGRDDIVQQEFLWEQKAQRKRGENTPNYRKGGRGQNHQESDEEQKAGQHPTEEKQ